MNIIMGVVSIILMAIGIIGMILKKTEKNQTGDDDMDILKEKVLGAMDQLNQDWVQSLKSAAESGEGVDLSEMFAKYSKTVTGLDREFAAARDRKNQKKRLFG